MVIFKPDWKHGKEPIVGSLLLKNIMSWCRLGVPDWVGNPDEGAGVCLVLSCSGSELGSLGRGGFWKASKPRGSIVRSLF